MQSHVTQFRIHTIFFKKLKIKNEDFRNAQNLFLHEEKRNHSDGSNRLLLGDDTRLGSNAEADQVPVCWDWISAELRWMCYLNECIPNLNFGKIRRAPVFPELVG